MSTSELGGDIASSADAVAMLNIKEAGVATQAVIVEAIAGSKVNCCFVSTGQAQVLIIV